MIIVVIDQYTKNMLVISHSRKRRAAEIKKTTYQLACTRVHRRYGVVAPLHSDVASFITAFTVLGQ